LPPGRTASTAEAQDHHLHTEANQASYLAPAPQRRWRRAWCAPSPSLDSRRFALTSVERFLGSWAKPTATHMSIDRQFGWMWAQACELLDRADRMQRGFVRYVGPSADAAVRANAAVWEPPVDIQETPGGLHFVFALPGVHPDHIEVSLEPNALTVSAVRPARLGGSDSVVRRMEIPHGHFIRRIALAGARFRLGDTRYLNGCLEVRLVRAGLGASGENRGQE
jgi:HSP20 family protein